MNYHETIQRLLVFLDLNQRRTVFPLARTIQQLRPDFSVYWFVVISD